MKEQDVRIALHGYLSNIHYGDSSDVLIVDELGVLEGSFRVDVAVIGHELHGYEIKSPADNLDRLPLQQKNFGKVFDRMTLVCADKYVQEAVHLVPDWWGLISVSRDGSVASLNEIWPARLNPSANPLAMCQLLWREEALEVLKDHGLDYGLRTKSRKAMWRVLSTELDKREIRNAIRDRLSRRIDWRPTLQRRAQ